MDLKTCYEELGGDYENVLGRLSREQLVEKFMLKFLNDKSYSQLVETMEAHDVEEAFRAAHTLKGVCQNLSFSKLNGSSVQVTEALRAGDYDAAVQLMPQLTDDYQTVVRAIESYKASEEV
jgi:HPt (histidine-containing phosphotransfer) domain-containing protein